MATQKNKVFTDEVELELPKEIALLVTNVNGQCLGELPEDHVAAFKIKKDLRLQPVIQKEAEELTKEDLIKHKDKADTAILQELAN